MKRMIYQVYLGSKNKLYEYCTHSVAEYCKTYGIDHVIQREPILRIKPDLFSTNRHPSAWEKYGGFLPIFEKENAFSYWPKYDQIAIIDSDIWIRPGAPNIFEELPKGFDFGGVPERDMPITNAYRARIKNYSEEQYRSIKVDWKWDKKSGAEFINMGLMVMNKSITKYIKGQTPHQFLRRPEFKPFVDGVGAWKWSTDQTLLNTWIKEERMAVKNLNWKWNCLYNPNFGGVKEEFVKDSHFVHFFQSARLGTYASNMNSLIETVS